MVPLSENPGDMSRMPLPTFLTLKMYLQACSQWTFAKMSCVKLAYRLAETHAFEVFIPHDHSFDNLLLSVVVKLAVFFRQVGWVNVQVRLAVDRYKSEHVAFCLWTGDLEDVLFFGIFLYVSYLYERRLPCFASLP